jgi:SRSO17 transposase
MEFCQDYSTFFISQGRNRTDHARQYLSGLLGDIRRKNIERIGEKVADVSYQSVHNFVSESSWDYRALSTQIAKDTNTLLGGNAESMLLIDETSFLKKGTHSVGVARQYCGCSGKIENGQVSVLGALGCQRDATLIDYRLYLPVGWTEDTKRLNRAKVPQDQREFKTKPELAWEIIETAKANQLEFSWVGMDSLYGSNSELLEKLEAAGLGYVADLRSNRKFYFKDSQGQLQHKRVDKAWLEWGGSQAEHVHFRNATKGPLHAQVLVLPIYNKGGSPTGHSLIISCDGTGAIKYSLTNGEGTAREHCYRQHQRYWIERAIQEAKSEVGMAEYQVRGWQGWHQHMAMVTLAMLFALQQKLAHRDTAWLLSTHDIVELLSFYLPCKQTSEDEVFRQLQERHLSRLKSIAHYCSKRKPKQSKDDLVSLTM